jgi:hypothetical protein
MSKVVKGIGKAVKGIVKGVKKAYKSITKSTLGKALLIGATIYLGGAALGYWNSPFTSINGVLAGGAPAAAEAGAVTATQATEAGTTLAGVEGGTAAETLGAGINIEPASAVAKEMAAGSTVLGGGSAAAPVSGVYAPAAEATKGGFIKNWWAGLSDPVKLGFTVSGMQTAGNMLASAFSPDALDVAERQAELERENMQWRNDFLYGKNLDVGQFQLGMTPSNQPLRDSQGNLIYATPQVALAAPGVQPVQPAQPIQPRGFIAQAMGR